MNATEEDSDRRLVVMARQIADFFRSYPEERASRAVADHINQFWTRRMRDEFLAIPGLRDGALDPLLTKAVASIRPGRADSSRDKSGA